MVTMGEDMCLKGEDLLIPQAGYGRSDPPFARAFISVASVCIGLDNAEIGSRSQLAHPIASS